MLHGPFNPGGTQPVLTGIKPGLYVDLTVPLGGPDQQIRISAPSFNKKAKLYSASITRLSQKDVTGDTPVREQLLVTLNIQAPSSGSFTVAEIRKAVEYILSVSAEGTLTDIFKGRI